MSTKNGRVFLFGFLLGLLVMAAVSPPREQTSPGYPESKAREANYERRKASFRAVEAQLGETGLTEAQVVALMGDPDQIEHPGTDIGVDNLPGLKPGERFLWWRTKDKEDLRRGLFQVGVRLGTDGNVREAVKVDVASRHVRRPN